MLLFLDYVGIDALLVLQRHHATVSIVHAFTKNPEQITCEADIVVTAAGVPNLVRGNWLKPGAVVIDVGTNPIEVKYHAYYFCMLFVTFVYNWTSGIRQIE